MTIRPRTSSALGEDLPAAPAWHTALVLVVPMFFSILSARTWPSKCASPGIEHKALRLCHGTRRSMGLDS